MLRMNKRGKKMLEGKKRKVGGVKSSISSSDEKQTAIVRHKHACHLRELVGGGWLIRILFFLLFCANGRKMEGENEHDRDRHLYFIGQAAVKPVKLIRCSPEEGG